MATQPIAEPLISVEEYLRTVYESDCEYNEGVVEERNLGEFEHSLLQGMLVTIFMNQISQWGVFALPEQRVQLRPRRFIVPDVAVLRMGLPRERILTRPPLIAIEIMSPEDRMKKVTAQSLEYRAFGVEHIWVIDPQKRVAYRWAESGLELEASGELTVPGTAILVRVDELFARLDQF